MLVCLEGSSPTIFGENNYKYYVWEAYLTTRETPTPTISYAIRTKQARGGINFTASHNPPQYNGMKFSTADGAPALPEITKKVETRIAEFQAGAASFDPAPSDAAPIMLDPRADYLQDLASKIDFSKIAAAKLRLQPTTVLMDWKGSTIRCARN